MITVEDLVGHVSFSVECHFCDNEAVFSGENGGGSSLEQFSEFLTKEGWDMLMSKDGTSFLCCDDCLSRE